jgi:hypothetical protein
MAFVERQEIGERTNELRRHHHFGVTHREMHERTAREGQQWLHGLSLRCGMSVEAILVHCVLDGLGEVRLHLHRGDRQAIEEQHQIDAVLIREGIAHLSHYPQPIGVIAGEYVAVHGQRRLELGEVQRCPQPDQFHSMPQQVQRSTLLELLSDTIQQHRLGGGPVVPGERLPSLGLRRLNPSNDIAWKQGASAIIASRVVFCVEPAVYREVVADLCLEADLFVQRRLRSPA